MSMTATGSHATGAPPTAASQHGSFSIRTHIVFASATIAFLIFGLGGWAATANLSGAVIAPGTFVVERNVKKVQHSYGGIVAEINVKNGDHVRQGQVLMRLDPTQTQAELGVVKSQLNELKARSVRLVAERDGLSKLNFPQAFLDQSVDAKAAAEGEIRLFEESLRARESQKDQLKLKIDQTQEEIGGLVGQRDAKAGEMQIISKELASVKELYAKQLTAVSRVYAMERDVMRLGGEHGSLIAQIARAKAQISEIKVQIIGVDENVRAGAQRDLRAAEAKISELVEREIATGDKMNRIDIRSPQTGLVHELAVHTIGGVVSPAEQIMLIVPGEDNLTVQARLAPIDVDQVAVGRTARLRLSAFAKQKTPEVDAHVMHISADVTVDPKNGQNYYIVRLEMDEKARKTVQDLKLVPGMPVEVFMSTGERTALSYLAKPFIDQANRAFRE